MATIFFKWGRKSAVGHNYKNIFVSICFLSQFFNHNWNFWLQIRYCGGQSGPKSELSWIWVYTCGYERRLFMTHPVFFINFWTYWRNPWIEFYVTKKMKERQWLNSSLNPTLKRIEHKICMQLAIFMFTYKNVDYWSS